MNTLTDEHITDLLGCVGRNVTVTTSDGYRATGRLIGLTVDVDTRYIRVLGRDRLERRVPLPATVTVNGR